MPIGRGSERGIGRERLLGREKRTEVGGGRCVERRNIDVSRGLLYGTIQSEELEDGLMKSFVEIGQKRERLLINGCEVVGIIEEIRTVLVGRNECRKVLVPPVAVVGEAYIAHGGVRGIVAHNGYGECQRACWGSNAATVAVGLLDEVLATVFHYAVGGIDVGVELYGAKIGRGGDEGVQDLEKCANVQIWLRQCANVQMKDALNVDVF